MTAPTKKRAAGLVRVSTAAQQHKYGLAAQEAAICAYAHHTGLEVVDLFSDVVSGTSESRPEFYNLLSRAREFDVVIVSHLDRIARENELGFRHMRLIREAGLELHAANRGLIEDNLTTGLEVLISKEERARITNRMFSGLLAKARTGLVPTSIQLYGLRDVPGTGRVTIDPLQAEIIRFLFEHAANGDSYHELARKLNALPERRLKGKAQNWYPGHLARIVRQSAYKGDYYWPANSTRGVKPLLIPIPAIVDADTWAKAQRRKVGRPPRTDRPLVGHLRCGWCGSSISSTMANRGRNYIYRCNGKNREPVRCKLPVIHGPSLERQVDRAVRITLTDERKVAEILAAVTPPDDPNAETRQELADRDKRWLEAFQAGAITAGELGAYRSEIRAEARALTAPVREVEFSFAEYAKAARTLPLKELLEYARIVVVVTHEGLNVTFLAAG